jgi:hypothetical protein
MDARTKKLLIGSFSLAFVALSLFSAPFETFGLDFWSFGWLISRTVQSALLAGGLTLVVMKTFEGKTSTRYFIHFGGCRGSRGTRPLDSCAA